MAPHAIVIPFDYIQIKFLCGLTVNSEHNSTNGLNTCKNYLSKCFAISKTNITFALVSHKRPAKGEVGEWLKPTVC